LKVNFAGTELYNYCLQWFVSADCQNGASPDPTPEKPI
jgi:hypothetical protein